MNIKFFILAHLLFIPIEKSYAEYTAIFPLEISNGGSLPDNSINISSGNIYCMDDENNFIFLDKITGSYYYYWDSYEIISPLDNSIFKTGKFIFEDEDEAYFEICSKIKDLTLTPGESHIETSEWVDTGNLLDCSQESCQKEERRTDIEITTDIQNGVTFVLNPFVNSEYRYTYIDHIQVAPITTITPISTSCSNYIPSVYDVMKGESFTQTVTCNIVERVIIQNRIQYVNTNKIFNFGDPIEENRNSQTVDTRTAIGENDCKRTEDSYWQENPDSTVDVYFDGIKMNYPHNLDSYKQTIDSYTYYKKYTLNPPVNNRYFVCKIITR